MSYRIAPEVQEIADELLAEVPAFERLQQRCIVKCVMAATAKKKHGYELPGKAHIVSGIPAVLILDATDPGNDVSLPHDTYVVEVALPYWQLCDDKQRRGLVDHVLSHFDYDLEKQAFKITPPEFGEFPGVLRRNGFWRPDSRLEDMAEAMSEQLTLFEGRRDIEEFKGIVERGEVEVSTSVPIGKN